MDNSLSPLRSIELDGYRFIENSRDHLHQRLVNGEWKNLTGVSSVVKDITNFSIAAYYGSRRALMALGYDPKDKPNNLAKFQRKVLTLLASRRKTRKVLLKEAYKAHATYSKTRAEKGTNSHDILDKWIKQCLAEIDGRPMPSDEPVVNKFVEMTKSYEPQFVASEKHGYNDDPELWLGGICDLIVTTNQGLGIWDFKDRPAIYEKDLLQMGGYAWLFPMDFTHVLGVPLEGRDARVLYDVPSLKEAFKSQLKTYRYLQSISIPK